MKSIASKTFWNAVACKIVEQFISVKLWIMFFASIFAWKLFNIVVEIKDVTLSLSKTGGDLPNEQIVSLLTQWSGKMLDITLAFFTAVIVVILLSREVFKHSKIKLNHKEEKGEVDNIQSGMV